MADDLNAKGNNGTGAGLPRMMEDIEKMGARNRELLERRRDVVDLIVPAKFEVVVRVGDHIYGNSSDVSVAQIDFRKSAGIRRMDSIRAYFFGGEYVEMEHRDGVSYVCGDKVRRLPMIDGKYYPGKVLVKRELGQTEKAFMLDVLDLQGKISSRDVDVDLIQSEWPAANGDLMYWLGKRLVTDFEGYEVGRGK